MKSKKRLSHRYTAKFLFCSWAGHLSSLGLSLPCTKHGLEFLRSILVLMFSDHTNVDILSQTLSLLMMRIDQRKTKLV